MHWTRLTRKAFETKIEEEVDLDDILCDIDYGLGGFTERALDLVMRHHLRWASNPTTLSRRYSVESKGGP